VELPEESKENDSCSWTICIEPDGGLDFTITETWHTKPQQWQDFFYIEVYRTLPPVE
jgi:hypothetical protein